MSLHPALTILTNTVRGGPRSPSRPSPEHAMLLQLVALHEAS